jgi:sugar O-acyltransferase (sialic acid O-acetyltransferase NeuD family)
MQRAIILGCGENVLSLVLETFRATGNKGPFTIVQNISVEIGSIGKFLPEGVHVDVLPAGFEIDLPSSALYFFGVASAKIKKAVFSFFSEGHGIEKNHYGQLIHPTAVLASTVSVSNGIYVEPLSVISPFAKLGFGVTVNRNVSIGHHSELGDFVTIGPGVNIAGHTHIGEGAQVGIGAVVFDRVSIGKNSVIGGGSIVTKDIPDNVIAWGNPCRVVKKVE